MLNFCRTLLDALFEMRWPQIAFWIFVVAYGCTTFLAAVHTPIVFSIGPFGVAAAIFEGSLMFFLVGLVFAFLTSFGVKAAQTLRLSPVIPGTVAILAMTAMLWVTPSLYVVVLH